MDARLLLRSAVGSTITPCTSQSEGGESPPPNRSPPRWPHTRPRTSSRRRPPRASSASLTREWLGPDALRRGRVLAAGIDTLSPCWYAEPGSPLARAMRALATQPSGRAWLLPESVGGYRVGWFVGSGLVFAEGRAAENLCGATELPAAMRRLRSALEDRGIPIATVPCAGLRRLDVAVDLCTDSAAEGLALLECVGATSSGARKLAAYRAHGRVESVSIKSRAGRTLARLYDKGIEAGVAARGRWLRLEAQWRLPRGERIDPAEIDPALLRDRFRRRFDPLCQAAAGFRLGGLETVTDRLEQAVASGQLQPSRARSIAGYLVLRSAGVPQGASSHCL